MLIETILQRKPLFMNFLIVLMRVENTLKADNRSEECYWRKYPPCGDYTRK